MPALSLACHLPHNTPNIPSRYNNEQTTKQTKAINNSYIYIYIYISHVNVTQTVPDISPLMPMHQDPLLVWDWRVDLNKFFADMLNVFFSTGWHFVAALSAWSYKDRSCISRRTMMYCELWGGVRMSNHCDVTFTQWGTPLPLILSTISFDECTGWLSFNCCISLICMGDLIGYLIDVTTLVKQHIHYNQILLCNWWQHFRIRLNTCNLRHKKLLLCSL